MEKNTKAVAAATKKETANAATSAAKTATPSTAAGLKPAAEKPETPKAEAKPAAPVTAAPAPTKTETPKPTTAAPAAAAAPTAAPEAPKPAQTAQEAENAAKVAAFAAELQRKQSLADMQRQINEELQRLNHKKEVADKRGVFLSCSGKIDEYLKQLQQETEFDTNICRLTFEIYEKNQYGREEFHDLMTVSNTAIVTKFCNALKEEIAAKVAELETELLKA
jgi:Predicted membrane protein